MQLLQGAFYIALPSIPGEVYLVAQPSFGPGYKPLSTQRSTLCDMRCWEELSLEGQSPTPFCLESPQLRRGPFDPGMAPGWKDWTYSLLASLHEGEHRKGHRAAWFPRLQQYKVLATSRFFL